jgi:hypothetical protein
MDKYWEEKFGSIALVVMSIFIAVNVREDVGVIYMGMALTYMILVFSNKVKAIEIISTPTNFVRSIVIVALFFSVWVVASSFILGILNPMYQINIFSLDLFKILSTMAETTVISNDPAVIFAVWGVFIPVDESVFFLTTVLIMFGILLGTAKFGQIRWQPRNPKMWMNCILVGITAALFHMTVRQYVSYALVADAIFFTLSSVVVFYTAKKRPSADMKEAIVGHIINNSTVLLLGGA